MDVAVGRVLQSGDRAGEWQPCLIFSMFLLRWGWLLRMSFSITFGTKSEKERGQDEGDDSSFFRRKDKAIAQGFKPRAPNWFQLSDRTDHEETH